METSKTLKSLLNKLNKLEAQIKKAIDDPYYWRPAYGKKIETLYNNVWAMKDEFAVIGYKLDPISRIVTKIGE